MTEEKFNQVLLRYANEYTMDCEEYEEMSWRQKDVVQAIKRAFKRIEAKAKKNGKD